MRGGGRGVGGSGGGEGTRRLWFEVYGGPAESRMHGTQGSDGWGCAQVHALYFLYHYTLIELLILYTVLMILS